MMQDHRAVTVALTHALTITITVVLIGTLLIGVGDLRADQRDAVAREQLQEIGDDVVSQINTLDHLNATGERVNATVTPTYPDRVASSEYDISIENGGHPFDTTFALAVSSERLPEPILFPLDTTAASLETAQAEGGQVPICLHKGDVTLGRKCE